MNRLLSVSQVPKLSYMLMKFLTKIGIFISFSSFFLTWFSCQTPSKQVTLNYIDVMKSVPPIFNLYGLFLVITVGFLTKVNVRVFFSVFFLLFFLIFLFLFLIFDWLTDVGIHMTVDFSCNAEFGFWCHLLGLVFILLGGCNRAIAHSTHD